MPARMWFDHFGEIGGNRQSGELPQGLVGPASAFQLIRDPNQFPDRLDGSEDDIVDAASQLDYLASYIPHLDTSDTALRSLIEVLEGQHRATTFHTVTVDRDLTIADADVLIDLRHKATGNLMVLLFAPDGRYSRLLLPDLNENEAVNSPKLQGTTDGLRNVVFDDEAEDFFPVDPETGGRYQPIPLDNFDQLPDYQLSRGDDPLFELEGLDGSSAGTYTLAIINSNNNSTVMEDSQLLRFEIGILDADLSADFQPALDGPGDLISGPVPALVRTGPSHFSESASANGPDDTDIYSFTADATSEFTIRVAGVNATAIVGTTAEILDASGVPLIPLNFEKAIEGEDPVYLLEQGASYFAMVRFPDQGSEEDNALVLPVDYSITVRPVGFVSDGPIKLGEKREITIDSPGQFRTVSLTMPEGVSGKVKISFHGMDSGLRDTELFVRQVDNSGIAKLLAWNDDRSFNPASDVLNRDASLVVELNAEEQIFILCHDATNGTGKGILELSLEGPDPVVDSIGENPNDAGQIQTGVVADGVLEQSDDADWFKFVPSEPGEYIFTISGIGKSRLAPRIVILNEFGEIESDSQAHSPNGSAIAVLRVSEGVAGATFFVTAQAGHSFAPPLSNARYTISSEISTPVAPLPAPEANNGEQAISIALTDPSFLRVVLVTIFTGQAQEPIATLPEQPPPSAASESPPNPLAVAGIELRPGLAEQEILQGAALDIIATGAIDQLAIFAGKGPADMPPEFWRLVAWAADGVSQAPSGFSLMGDRLLRLGEGPASAIAKLREGLLPTLGESAGRTPTTMELVADAAFLPAAEPTGIFIAQPRFRRHWLEAAIVIISSAGATALAWPPRRDREKTNPLQADGYIWN